MNNLRKRSPTNSSPKHFVLPSKRKKNFRDRKLIIPNESLIGMGISVILAFVFTILIALFIYHGIPWIFSHIFGAVYYCIQLYHEYFADLEAQRGVDRNILKLNQSLILNDFQSSYEVLRPVVFPSRNGPSKREHFLELLHSKMYSKEKFCLLNVFDHAAGLVVKENKKGTERSTKSCKYIALDEFSCLTGQHIIASAYKNFNCNTSDTISLLLENRNHFMMVDAAGKVTSKIMNQRNRLTLPPSLPTSIDGLNNSVSIAIAYENDDAINKRNGHPVKFIPIKSYSTLEMTLASNVSAISGSTFRMEPSQWSELITGQKQWFFYKADQFPKVGYNPYRNLAEWINQTLPRLPESLMPLQLVQEAGQIVYIPEGWYFACRTISRESISISGYTV